MPEYDAGDPVETITSTDPTPTPPNGIAAVTRYFGLIHAPALTVTPDRPFVLQTIHEAHDLLAAVTNGGLIDVREWVGGVVVAQRTRFVVTEGAEMVLYRVDEPPAHFDWGYPDLLVKVGPRGGISHERP